MMESHKVETSKAKKQLPLWLVLIVLSLLQIFTVISIFDYLVISKKQAKNNNLNTQLPQQPQANLSTQTALDQIKKLNERTIAWLCLSSVFSIGVFWLLTLRMLASSQHRLPQSTEAIIPADLDDKVNLSKETLEDLEIIARSTNLIASQLQAFSTEFESKNRQLGERIEQHASELKNAKTKVAIANPSNSSLLADLGHELRSPLNAILGFTQIMQHDPSLSRSQQENLAIVHHSGEQLLASINFILELSKIEAGRITLYPTNFNFYNLLDNIEARWQQQKHKRRLKFTTYRHQDLPQYIYADEQRLNEIITNLLDNIVYFTSGGDITLRISGIREPKQSLKICWEIENTNSKITVTELEALFNGAIEPETKRKHQDVRLLGLPISRQLVRLMGGDIAVSHSPLGGICLKAHLSAQLGFAPQISTQPIHRRVVGLESDEAEYRILIVDDSKVNRQIMLQILEPVGFKIKEAVNGREAVDIWLEWQPHMIWMDVKMPVMNGYEATERIKSHPNNQATSIVALTASTWEEERSHLLQAGCDDFVGKPFSESIIFEKIAQYLGVNYLYEEPKLLTAKELDCLNTNFQLKSDSLRVMSSEWLLRLERAATELDREEITELLAEIPDEYSFLVAALQGQVDNFDFDKIIDLVEQVKKPQTLTLDLN
jgi:signal transduction histidine kinase/CheY-like chemotaxis protein